MADHSSGSGPRHPTAGRSARAEAAHLARQAETYHQRSLAARESAHRWTVGALGEERVGHLLDALAGELTALHDRLLEPGLSSTNLDHIVVSHAGVFVLDTKSWSGEIVVAEGTLWVHDGGRRWAKNRELAKIGRYADVMARALGVKVIPVLVLARDHHQTLAPTFAGGIHVVPAEQLRGWFLRHPVVLDDARCRRLRASCERAFPDATSWRPPAVLPVAPRSVAAPSRRRGHRSVPPPPRRAVPATRPAVRRRIPLAARLLVVAAVVLLGPPVVLTVAQLVPAVVTAMFSSSTVMTVPGAPTPTIVARPSPTTSG